MLLLIFPLFDSPVFWLGAQATFDEYLEAGGGSYKRGRLEEAANIFRQAMELTTEMEPLDIRRAVGMEKLAAVHHAMGELEKAQSLLESALKLRKSVEDGDLSDLAVTMNNLAVIHDELGKLDEAVSLYEACLRAWQEAVGPLHPGLAITKGNLAALYRAQGRYDNAERMYREILEARNLRSNRASSTAELVDLADVSAAGGRCEEAIGFYEEVISLESARLGPDHPRLADLWSRLGTCQLLEGSPDKAEPLYEKSIALLTATYGPTHPELARPLNDRATALFALGRYGEARVLYERAMAIWESNLGPNDPKIVNGLANLFLVYSYQGAEEAAQQVYARLSSITGASPDEVSAIRQALNHLRAETAALPQHPH